MPTALGPSARPRPKPPADEHRREQALWLRGLAAYKPPTDEERAEAERDRAERLQTLVQSDGWLKGALPVVHEVFDSAVRKVMDGELHPDALKALWTLHRALDAAGDVSRGTLQRLAVARLQQTAASEASRTA